MYYYQVHLFTLKFGYGPSEAGLTDDMQFVIPATAYEIAYVALLWNSMFAILKFDLKAKAFFTIPVVLCSGLLSLLLSELVDTVIGGPTGLYKSKDPILFYAVLGLAYSLTGTIAMLKKYTLLEGIVYYIILMHTCGLFLWRIILKIPFNTTVPLFS